MQKITYFHNTFAMYKHDMKKTWAVISETLNKNKKRKDEPLTFKCNGRDLSDDIEIANEFNRFFANIGENLASNMEQFDNHELSYKTYLQTPHAQNCRFELIDENATIKAIDYIDNKPSSGHDGISNVLLKYVKLEISKPLTLIINQMITTGIFPESLKIAKIIPIYKKGEPTDLSNYRPISLLPTISKIFERIIHIQLQEYFNSNNLLAEQQYGFRPNHSTEYAAVKLVDHISNTMDGHKIPGTIFIDLSKAFDTLSYDILLYKLKFYGISGLEHKLIASYLSNRKQYVMFNNKNSEFTEIRTGVPQGSILGPLLFSIYINDLIKMSNKLNFIMYSDDTTIYFDLEDFEKDSLEHQINEELKRVNIWLKLNKLTLNATKTKSMVFHRKQKQIEPLHFSIDGKVIENVSSFNFLGITLDEGLTWKNHIDLIKNKISKTIGVFYRLAKIFPEEILVTLYNSLIASHLNYGILAWGIAAPRLEKLQKKAIRLITNSKYIAHTNPLFKRLQLLKIVDIFKLRVLKFYYNLYNGLLPVYFNVFLDIITREPLRVLRNPLIHQPVLRTKYAECNLLFQLINVINSLKNDPCDTILKKVHLRTHTYKGFAFNVTHVLLNAYDPICRLRVCYVCN